MKRVLVDMSTTLLHQGHIRLLEKAKAFGYVIVALTTDDEVLKHKGYCPELKYEERKEILSALKFVDEVVPSPWIVDEQFARFYDVDCLIHAGPNANKVEQVISFDRTDGISTSDLRDRAIYAIIQKRNSERPMLTPGPGNLHPECLLDLQPFFSRDDRYEKLEAIVLERVTKLTGKDSVTTLQGSATTAIEVATSSFLSGNVVVITSGFYSQRMFDMLQKKRDCLRLDSLSAVTYEDALKNRVPNKADWIVSAYTETADAFLVDLPCIAQLAEQLGAKLMLDATGSINLEQNHEVADVLMFSSCKGLGGLAGAGFIAYDRAMLDRLDDRPKEFILDLMTYIERRTTPPVHAISSLYALSQNFQRLGERVRLSKQCFIDRFMDRLIHRKENQPALCTMISGSLVLPESVVAYHPRNKTGETQVVCHLFDQFPSRTEIGELYESFRLL